MNKSNVQKAINVMLRVKARGDNFDMSRWQQVNFSLKLPEQLQSIGILNTERELHECGSAACFGGWVASSPEFAADGGKAVGSGYPILDGTRGARAIALWLDIEPYEARALCLDKCFISENIYTEVPRFTDTTGQTDIIDPGLVTVDMVIAALDRLLATGSVFEAQE